MSNYQQPWECERLGPPWRDLTTVMADRRWYKRQSIDAWLTREHFNGYRDNARRLLASLVRQGVLEQRGRPKDRFDPLSQDTREIRLTE